MNSYTVVGYYSDNDQPWIVWARAESPRKAAANAVTRIMRRQEVDLSNVVVVEVFRGWQKGCYANEHNVPGNEVYAR